MTTQGNCRSSPVVRYCADGGGIELEGTVEGLRRLSELLLSASPQNVLALAAQPLGADASPYDGFLSSVLVVLATGKARVGRRGDSLLIEGSETALASLAQDIATLTTVNPDEEIEETHIHIEYYDHHPQLAPESEPLVVNRLSE